MHSVTQPAAPEAPEASALTVRDALLNGLAAEVERRLAPLLEASERPEPLLTVGDVAAYLNVSKRTVETLISEGELVPLRIRGVRRFTRNAIDAYVRKAELGRAPV